MMTILRIARVKEAMMGTQRRRRRTEIIEKEKRSGSS
jgi:hypothetical protein